MEHAYLHLPAYDRSPGMPGSAVPQRRFAGAGVPVLSTFLVCLGPSGVHIAIFV